MDRWRQSVSPEGAAGADDCSYRQELLNISRRTYGGITIVVGRGSGALRISVPAKKSEEQKSVE